MTPTIAIVCKNDYIKEYISTAQQESALDEICTPVFHDDVESALADDEVDAVVLASPEIKLPAGTQPTLFLSRDFRLSVAESIDITALEQFHALLQRDFSCSNPRIAIVLEEEADLSELFGQAEEKKICIYGAYKPEDFFARNMHTHFDGIISTAQLKEPSDEWLVSYASADDQLIAVAHGKESLLQAMYNCIDIMRNQVRFDEARVSPLPKLFHDRRENG